MRSARLLTLAFACSVSALPVVTVPWFGQIPLDGLVGHLSQLSAAAECNRTIYQILKADAHYSRLLKAIDLSESVVDLLSDPSKSITFFALPNSKLPDKPHHGGHRHDENLVPSLADDLSGVSYDLGYLVQLAEELEEEPETCDKEKRKETLARIIRKIIAYHILPDSYETADLVQRSTYATNLTLDDGSMDSQPLRLSVLKTLIPCRLKINMFVEVTKGDIKAKNGVIHQISHPLLPPLSIFQETFFVPEAFSVYTSAMQRVGLTGAIDRWQCCGDDEDEAQFEGARATTAFVPTSDAFERLPKKLKSYLFSPFGEKALKKLLEYHIIPNFVLHSDYIHGAAPDATESSRSIVEHAPEAKFVPLPFDEDTENSVSYTNAGFLLELVYEYNATLPSLLADHNLQVHVMRYEVNLPLPGFPRYFTTLKVNGHHAGPFDITTRNGALHVLPIILDPRQGRDHHPDCGHGEAAWEDWEEWLPQWAMED